MIHRRSKQIERNRYLNRSIKLQSNFGKVYINVCLSFLSDLSSNVKDRKYVRKKAMWWIAGWKKLKRDKRRYFLRCVESSDSRRVISKRANDNVTWPERVFVRNRGNGNGSEKQARLGNGYYASSVVTMRRVTSFRKAAWRKRTEIRRNDLLSVIVRWEEIYRIGCEYGAIEQAYVVCDCARSIAIEFVRTRKVILSCIMAFLYVLAFSR